MKDKKKYWNRNKYTLLLLGLLVIGAGISLSKVYVTNILQDSNSNSSVVIDFTHYQIHQGEHFYVGNFTTLNDNEEINFIVETGNKKLHMTFIIYGTSQLEIYIYENSTITSGTGTILESINNNRNSNIICTSNISYNPTIINYGKEIFRESRGFAGVNQASSEIGLIQRDNEIILKENETYIFRIVSRDDSNIVSYVGEWYNGYDPLI